MAKVFLGQKISTTMTKSKLLYNLAATVILLRSLSAMPGATSQILADGNVVTELVPGAASFELRFAMTEEAAKNGYGFSGPMKAMLKARGGADFQFAVMFNLKDNNGCGEANNPMYQQDGSVKAMGWINIAKAGETVNVIVKGKDVYDNLNNMLNKCGSSPSSAELEIRLLTIHRSKFGKGGSSYPEHELSKMMIPIPASSISAMMEGADDQTYNEFLTGNKAHRVKDEALSQAIEDELKRLKKPNDEIITIHIQDIVYKNSTNTVFTWYAHNIYKNTDGQCKYGYIYGEASKAGSSYSFRYFNGEKEEFIGCTYAEKLRNR